MIALAWFLGALLLLTAVAAVAYRAGVRDGRLAEVKAAILHLDNDAKKRRAL